MKRMKRNRLQDYIKAAGVTRVSDVAKAGPISTRTLALWYDKGHLERIDALIEKAKEQAK